MICLLRLPSPVLLSLWYFRIFGSSPSQSSALVLVICLNYWIKPLPFQCSCPNLSQQLSNLHSLRYSQYSFENVFFWYSTRRIWYTQCWNRGWWFVWFFRKFQQKIPKTRKLKEFLLKMGPSTRRLAIFSNVWHLPLFVTFHIIHFYNYHEFHEFH